MSPTLLRALWPLLKQSPRRQASASQPAAQPAPGADWVMAPWWRLLGKAGG
jgi:hypothetical protein